MSEYRLGNRLASAAALVREGAYLADVGTDHAYLPIALMKEGRISAAICSDINKGPLERAKDHVAESGLSGRVELMLAPGASAIAGRGVTDVAICGMGGELIASIINDAPYLKDKDINLVLQPMSKVEALRAYLWDNGFDIVREIYSVDDGKYYVCFSAHYTGEKSDYTEPELYFGRNISAALLTESGRAYVENKLASLRRAAEGKRAGGDPSPSEMVILEQVEKLLKG